MQSKTANQTSLFPLKLSVEGEIYFEHIDARLSEEAQIPMLNGGGNEMIYGISRYSSGLGNSRRLRIGIRYADVRVETTPGRTESIRRNRA